ncbi:hypothetical protein B9G69_014195 [Bdellovibrio sp. SKB1291214]|uniref:hypothetical protein n=1 Tax=Bdellovibrio sp. SKB1291214 TaxID=1732569 RepID=UPI0011305997|nr:hypothetical protein [Bdellovibrio sp. SKB1291214]UYL08199.1 hypothetical protein B9G69_014195 [Bdellovibrio sp. SKB1291214]
MNNSAWFIQAKQKYLVFREFILADLKNYSIDTVHAAVDRTHLFAGLSRRDQETVLQRMTELTSILREINLHSPSPRNQKLLWMFLKAKGVAIDPNLFEGLSDDIHFDVYDTFGNCKIISPRVFEFTKYSIDEVFCIDLGRLNPLDRDGSQILNLIKNVKVQSKYEGWAGFCTLSEPLRNKTMHLLGK